MQASETALDNGAAWTTSCHLLLPATYVASEMMKTGSPAYRRTEDAKPRLVILRDIRVQWVIHRVRFRD